MESKQLKELLLQSLEHEMGGIKIYEAAIGAAQNSDLKKEWQKYLSQTRHHVEVLQKIAQTMGLDAEEQTPGRKILKKMGQSLVEAIEEARKGDPAAAEIVACECVVLAETKDHLDWELIGEVSSTLKGEKKKELHSAYEEIEDEEDEHLYHTRGWCRELWLQSLGMEAVLPPPEERKHVRTAIAAAKAQQSRHH